MKIKITAIIGSNNKKSFTKELVSILLEEIAIKMSNNNIEFDILPLNNYKLQMCTGCENCFKKGFCNLDKAEGDDFLFIKKKCKILI